jgi:hypothetical protein
MAIGCHGRALILRRECPSNTSPGWSPILFGGMARRMFQGGSAAALSCRKGRGTLLIMMVPVIRNYARFRVRIVVLAVLVLNVAARTIPIG